MAAIPPANPNPIAGVPVGQVQAGGAPQFQPKTVIISDEEDPITVIAKAAAQASGKAFSALGDDFKLHGSFKKNASGAIELLTFRNPPGPHCYCMIRKWEVTVKDAQGVEKPLSFEKKIYTNVVIPQSFDGKKHKEKEYVAGIAANMYAQVVEGTLRGQAGQANEMYDQVKDHISKIQRDRFITLSLYSGSKEVKVDKKPGFIQGLKGKEIGLDALQGRQITHVMLNVRMGQAKYAQDPLTKEMMETAHPIFDLSKGILSKKAAPALANKPTFKQKLQDKKYTVVANDNDPAYLRQVGKIKQTQDVREAVEEGVSVEEALADAGIEKAAFIETLNGDNKGIMDTFNQLRTLVDNPAHYESLASRFDKQPDTFDAEVKQLLNPKKNLGEKMKGKIQPKKPEPYLLLNKLNEGLATKDLGIEAKKDLNTLKGFATQALKQMKELDAQIVKNEDLLEGLEDEAIRRQIEIDKKARKATLKAIESALHAEVPEDEIEEADEEEGKELPGVIPQDDS